MSGGTDLPFKSEKPCHIIFVFKKEKKTVLLCIWSSWYHQALLGDNFELKIMGCMMAFPDCEIQVHKRKYSCTLSYMYQKNLIINIEQNWHGDGDHQSKQEHLPPYAVNIFIPLVDINKQNGPTEYKDGSEPKSCLVAILFMLLCNFSNKEASYQCAWTGSSLQVIFCAILRQILKGYIFILVNSYDMIKIRIFFLQAKFPMRAGQCLFFDYRIRHRGTCNRQVDEISYPYNKSMD